MIIKVEAMIREEKLEDVLDALAALDVHGMTCYQVKIGRASCRERV